MGVPVTKRYYGWNAAYGDGLNWCQVKETASIDTNTTWGWIVGTNTVPKFHIMNRGVEAARTSVRWSITASAQLPNSTVGDCYVFGPFNGTFAEGIWQITQSVKATTSATGQDGRFIYQILKGTNRNGTNASLITGSFFSSSVVTNLTTTVVTLTAPCNMPSVHTSGEYVFIQTRWAITGVATNTGADVDLVFGATRNSFLMPPFTSQVNYLPWISDDYPT